MRTGERGYELCGRSSVTTCLGVPMQIFRWAPRIFYTTYCKKCWWSFFILLFNFFILLITHFLRHLGLLSKCWWPFLLITHFLRNLLAKCWWPFFAHHPFFTRVMQFSKQYIYFSQISVFSVPTEAKRSQAKGIRQWFASLTSMTPACHAIL